jgi:hypothetical protein
MPAEAGQVDPKERKESTASSAFVVKKVTGNGDRHRYSSGQLLLDYCWIDLRQ